MNIFVVFADPIYARGLVVSLVELADVDRVDYAVGVVDALANDSLAKAHVVLLEDELPGGPQFAQQVSGVSDARVLLCTRRGWNEDLGRAAVAASGVLPVDALTPAVVAVAVRAISLGVGVLGIDLLRDVCGERPWSPGARDGEALTHPDLLTQREHAVLSLVAQGVPSREIASRLAYSERTIKNILHDAITKLGARSRSHAIALAVRDGII